MMTLPSTAAAQVDRFAIGAAMLGRLPHDGSPMGQVTSARYSPQLGKTIGMAILGLELVRRDGSRVGAGRVAIRVITFPLSFLLLGLGFLGILVGREHRALHDVFAGTTIVYAWDARAARLRFLATQRSAL